MVSYKLLRKTFVYLLFILALVVSVLHISRVLQTSACKAPLRKAAETDNALMTTSTTSEAPQAPVHRPTRGYVLAGHYWEQQTCASMDLQNLQCWAAISGLSVVEPYTSLSTLRTPFIALPHSEVLRFSDLFDLGSWNHQNIARRYSKLVPWEKFVEKAPRNVIMVKTVLEATETMQGHLNAIAQKFATKGNTLSQFVTNYTMDCDAQEDWRSPQEVNYMARNNFTVVRIVCINFAQSPYMNVERFNKMVFGEFPPDETVVYFRDWRKTGARASVQLPHCQMNYSNDRMLPSELVAAKADAYVAKYLNGSDYIAVMARLEKSILALNLRRDALQYCLNATLSEWRKLRESSGLQTTFLAADMGSHGTLTSPEINGTHFEEFVQQIYGDKMSVEEWERTFEEVAGTTDSGYIALLQKLIATRSKCVLFVGGGAFQRHTYRLYKQRNPTNHCIKVVENCTREKLPAH